MYSSRNIDDLREDVAFNCHKFVDLCKKAGLNVLITDTVRDKEFQLDCYNKGYSKTKTPSFHAQGVGLAFDFCKNVKGHEYDDIEFFKFFAMIGKRIGFEWGGDWPEFTDRPHLQWSDHGKLNSKAILAGKRPPTMPKYEERHEIKNGMYFTYKPIDEFRILYWDKLKRTTTVKNYGNGLFFAEFKEKVSLF
jgi:hypothetical protein